MGLEEAKKNLVDFVNSDQFLINESGFERKLKEFGDALKAEVDKVSYNLSVTATIQRPSGVSLTVSAKCGNWEFAQKFIEDFEKSFPK